MKKLNYFLFALIFTTMAFGQATVIEDNFDGYVAGQQLVCQNPGGFWDTWNSSPCDATTDPYVSDAVSSSSPNSVYIVTDNDLVAVYPSDYTSGHYKASFDIYVSSGSDGYFNTLQDFAGANSSWGMQAYFPSDGNGHVDAGGADAAFFSFPFDTWMTVEVDVDLDNDFAEFYLDGTFIVDWQWSTGAFGTNSLNQLSANNFYGNAETTGADFYIDNFMLVDMNAAPAVFTDDFEAYTVGQQLACQNPADWTTWSEDPCNATEDPLISDNYAFSGTNSTVIVQNNDLVYPTGLKNSGTWWMSMMVYIPAGGAGYFNAMTTFDNPTFEWAVEFYFDAGGTGRVEADQTYNFAWLPGVWQQAVLKVDLDNDEATFYFGLPPTEVATWQYTQGGTLAQQLDVFDFFGATSGDEMYFDDFYFGDEQPVFIPVELTSFTADVNDGNVTLNWTTATETNNQMFEVERKAEDGEFVRVGFVEGHGTTTEEQTYTYVDNNVTPGNYSYRLKQIDYSGGFQYFDAVNVTIEAPLEYALNQNYPNPFNPTTTINYSIPSAGKVNISVYNLLGQKVATLVDGFQEAGKYDVTFEANNLSSGVYFYKIVTDNFVQSKKMILSK